MMLSLYRAITAVASPAVALYLGVRLRRGKEDGARLKERFGYASLPRPPGTLIWMHAASVGEANSLLPLIESLQAHVLLTTGTVTSAALMAVRLPPHAMHQFAPVDTPWAVQRFLAHWQPDVALWAESELWPNMLTQCRATGARMALVNARLSQRSFARWSRCKRLIRPMLRCFDAVFAQSEDDAMRLRLLGAAHVQIAGNLKFDAAPLSCNEAALADLQKQTAERVLWLAASTHAGEEAIVAQAHAKLKENFPHLLTVIVPRHAARGAQIAQELAGLNIAQRSKHEPILPQTDIYLADSMGELGLFYRLCGTAFVGGSLVPHGGQNVLEAVRLGCAIVCGFYTHNFAAIVNALEQAGGIRLVDAGTLSEGVRALLSDEATRKEQVNNASRWLQAQGGASQIVLDYLRPLLERGEAA